MTVLDTFYLLFKTDTSQTKKDINDLEKQIDQLSIKGKKRTDLEDQALKTAKKRHKELNDELKEQNKQTEQLGSSFSKIIESGATALTAFASFDGIKNGIKDAQEFNRQLYIQSKISGQNLTQLKAYAAAYEQSGGSKEGFVSLIQGITKAASEAGRPVNNIRALIGAIAADLDKYQGLANKQFRLQTQEGLPLESLAFFEQSNDERERAIKLSEKLADATEDDGKKADEFGRAWSQVSDALTTDFTHLGSDLFPTLTEGMKKSAASLADLTHQKGGVELLFGSILIGAPIATSLMVKLGFAAAALAATLSRMVVPLTLFFEVGKATGDIFDNKPGSRQSAIGQGADAVSNFILDKFYGKGAGQTSFDDAAPSNPNAPASPVNLTRNNDISSDMAQYNANNAAIINAQAQIKAIQSQLAQSGGNISNAQTVNVKIDEVSVNTQATDSAGIANSVSSELQNHLRNALWAVNDGVGF